ncbi:hypothetical protein TELCIR_18273, partial [Teladorsagia circumcincta]
RAGLTAYLKLTSMGSTGPLEIPPVRKKSAEMYLHDYDLDDDLSIASPPVSKPIIDVEDPVDALSANREQTRLVAAGCRGVSGSRDAAVFLYDLREQDPVKKFGGTNSYDVIRDLSFCLHQDQHDQFVTSDDSGTIRLWDTRKGDKPLIQFPAHQGYAASIALNPRERHLIASGGGRDKFIK